MRPLRCCVSEGRGVFLDVRESPEVVLSLPVTAERPFVGLTGQRDLDFFGVPLCRGYDYLLIFFFFFGVDRVCDFGLVFYVPRVCLGSGVVASRLSWYRIGTFRRSAATPAHVAPHSLVEGGVGGAGVG